VPSTAKQQRIARDYFDKKFPDYELPLTVKNGPDGSKYFATTASTDDWVTSKSGCCRVAADGTITGVTLNAFMNLPTATEGKLTEAVGSKNVKEILRGVKWHQTDNDWHSAKSVAREIFKQLDDSDIDVMLALRNAAEVQRKKNSFLGAALAELAKDQAEKLGTTNRD
jgi:predicted nucleic acid-binding protein